ncbi:hypothetical protein TRVA0_011S03356 [Trichomonascus vanleenenianus]|uniref:Std1p n=1 Tax=Trichomonascus vanleenenianus TaxID=2268995 RepID=UPI003ECB9B64
MLATAVITKTVDFDKSPPSSFVLPKKSNRLFLPLRAVVPTDFSDMYAPEILASRENLNGFGRPKFTSRQLVDWSLNDLRSLLIVDSVSPQWHGVIPRIVEQGYRIIVLPLDASDDRIIDTLVSSDLYKEHNFDPAFLYQTARYTIEAARQRYAFENGSHGGALTKPQWRNVIENYLLNLGCEAQCRLDYKKACSMLKKQRQQELAALSSSPSASVAPKPIKMASNSLLKKAIVTSASTSPDFPSYLRNKMMPGSAPVAPKVSLSRQDKQQVWTQVQSRLYARLGLDWETDDFSA